MKKHYKGRNVFEAWLLRKDSIWPIIVYALISLTLAVLFFLSPEIHLFIDGKSHLDPNEVFVRPENRRAIGVIVFIVWIHGLPSTIRLYLKSRKQKKMENEPLRKQVANEYMEKEIQERLEEQENNN